VLVTPHDDQAKEAVRRNAEAAIDWEYHARYVFLMRWAVRFNQELLDPIALPDRRPMPSPVISFEKVDHRILAFYRLHRNPQGLLDEITFNVAQLDRPDWDLLETLLHEQLHLKQQNFGKHPVDRNYHNQEFCQMAAAVGLHVFPVIGFHYAPAGEPFAGLMARYGIPRPPPAEVPRGEKRNWWDLGKEKEKGRSTLSKWQCPCGQTVRVGRKDWPGAVCKACGGEYARMEGKADQRAAQVLFAAKEDVELREKQGGQEREASRPAVARVVFSPGPT